MILACSKLITCQSRRLPIENSAIVVRGSSIEAIGPFDKIRKRFPGSRVLSLQNSLIMPGLVNLHSHLELPSLLECIRTHTFPGWIINLIRLKRNLSKRQYASACRQNISTLLQTGTTTVGEICTHGVSSSLLMQSGLRGFIFDEIIKMGPKDSKFEVPDLQFQRSHLFRPGLSLHSPYTVCESLSRDISSLSRYKQIRLAMHVAESKDEIRLLQRKTSGLAKLYQFAHWDLDWAPRGSSSFEYLHRIGFLSSNLLAVHAVQVTDGDIDIIKKCRVSIAHCPRSNNELGVGKMPLKKMLDAGITVGLGTDSLASVPTLNLWDEMRYAYKIHKKDGVTAEDIFKIATIGGAKALGMDSAIGTLEPGKKADIIVVPLPRNNTGDLHLDLLRETKFCILSLVEGRILMQER